MQPNLNSIIKESIKILTGLLPKLFPISQGKSDISTFSRSAGISRNSWKLFSEIFSSTSSTQLFISSTLLLWISSLHKNAYCGMNIKFCEKLNEVIKMCALKLSFRFSRMFYFFFFFDIFLHFKNFFSP